MRFARIEDVFAIADAVRPEYRSLVLTEAFATLRWGELAGLRRRHLDLLHATTTVSENLDELNSGRLVVGNPKTDAGRRTVALLASWSTSWRSTWRSGPTPARMALSSQRPRAGSSGGRTFSVEYGYRRSGVLDSKAFASTTCVTRPER